MLVAVNEAGEPWPATAAGSLLRDLTLFADRLDPAAEVDRALVTLLPGESATFTVTTKAALDPDQLTRKPVLRCVNDIRRGDGDGILMA